MLQLLFLLRSLAGAAWCTFLISLLHCVHFSVCSYSPCDLVDYMPAYSLLFTYTCRHFLLLRVVIALATEFSKWSVVLSPCSGRSFLFAFSSGFLANVK